MKEFKKIFDILKEPYMRILPGNVAFSFMVALIPILSIMVFLLNILNISSPVISSKLYTFIPEAVVEITSVTTQKTCRYENAFGQFSYQTIRPRLFWGFEPKTMRDGKQYMMATPEKAIIDLLYLYPQYATVEEMRELRLDEEWMQGELDKERLMGYVERIGSTVITKRVRLLLTAYKN